MRKGLEAIGSNLFLESPASGPPLTGTAGQDGLGTLRQGYLEESSVDAVREVTELIKAQRGYELNAKVITAADQMLSRDHAGAVMRFLMAVAAVPVSRPCRKSGGNPHHPGAVA